MIDLRIFFLTALLVLAAIAVGNFILPTNDDILLSHQLNKLNESADIIFVGDSSLGNSLDAEFASLMTKKKVVNFALTGGYGLIGSQIIIEKYLERHSPPEAIFVVQTVDSFSRSINANDIKLALNRDIVPSQLISARRLYLALKSYFSKNDKVDITNDYIKQGNKIDANVKSKLILHRMSDVNSNAASAIGAICARLKVKSYLACGPILDRYKFVADSYFSSLPKFHGLNTICTLTPFGISKEDIGDSIDHVAPEDRKKYTLKWVELIERLSYE